MTKVLTNKELEEKHGQPVLLSQLPEPLKTYAYNMLPCSHIDPLGGKLIKDADAWVYPEGLNNSWIDIMDGATSLKEDWKMQG